MKCLTRVNTIEVARDLKQTQRWALFVAKSSSKDKIQTPIGRPTSSIFQVNNEQLNFTRTHSQASIQIHAFFFKKTPVARPFARQAHRKIARLGPLFTPSTITTTTASDLQRGKLLTWCVCMCWGGGQGNVLIQSSCSTSSHSGQTSFSFLVIPVSQPP